MVNRSNLETKSLNNESKIDMKISFQSIKSNFRVYIPFLIGSLILFGLLSIFNFNMKRYYSGIFRSLDTLSSRVNLLLLYISVQNLVDLIIFSLILCIGYGLAHDIMSSGDGFTFIKNIFTYPWKYYVKFFLLTVIIYLPILSIELIFIYSSFFYPNHWYFLFFALIFLVFSLFWFVSFIEVGPMILSKRNFFKTIEKNFKIFAQNKKRIFKTWIIFWFVFFLPELLLNLVWNIGSLGTVIRIEIYFSKIPNFLFYLQMFQIILGYPIMTLLSTRIYNSIENEKLNRSDNILSKF